MSILATLLLLSSAATVPHSTIRHTFDAAGIPPQITYTALFLRDAYLADRAAKTVFQMTGPLVREVVGNRNAADNLGTCIRLLAAAATVGCTAIISAPYR